MSLVSSVQPWVDQLVLEQGRYAPVELLLLQAQLSYADYEAWRRGRAGVLEDHLRAERAQVRKVLRACAAYAAAIGLTPHTVQYTAWGTEADIQALRFSVDLSEDSLYCTLFERDEDRTQLDLFLDSSACVHENALVDALVQCKLSQAERELEQWSTVAGDGGRVRDYAQLLHAQRRAQSPVQDAHSELVILRDRIAPSAEALLGRRARDYLIPLWQRLAQALDSHRFDPERPQLHSSFAAVQALDWPAARASVEAEPEGLRHPTLLARHAQACAKLRDQPAMLADWCRLCWDHPLRASQLLATPSGAGLWLDPYWRSFQDLEQELPVTDFPAYLILAYPNLAQQSIELPDVLNEEAKAVFEHVLALARGQGEAVDEAVIAHRKALKALHPALFEYCLRAHELALQARGH